ncbi:hypothetical protein DDE82_007094 [Stemphylium lycopersici]|nr:hypothetical protein DDE82_007094 [Stemphylium lycopersici]
MDTTTNFRWNPFRRHVLGSIAEETPSTAPPLAAPKSKTWETTIQKVESWPEEARPLKTHTWLTCLYSLGDAIVVLLPMYFILLGIAVITLNGKPTQGSDFGSKVETAMDLTLELLMASQSVWGTFESQLLMQKLTVVGVNLLFLWALSPLGGQASLRLMARQMQDSHTSAKIRYMTTGPAASMWGLYSTYSGNGKFSDAGALYTAALLAPLATKLGPQDPWGNVKIPTLEGLNTSIPDSDGWFAVSSESSAPETYSSLVGLPIVGLPSHDRSKFNLEYTYLSVNCQPFTQAPWPGLNGSTGWYNLNATKLEELAPGQVWYEKEEDSPFGNPKISGERNSFFMDTTRSFPWGMKEGDDRDLYMGRLDGFFGNYNSSLMPEAELTTNRELLFVSEYGASSDGNIGLNIATCSLSQTHVEAAIQCKGSACATTKLRKSLKDTRPAALTGLEHGTIMAGFVEHFPRAVSFAGGSSPTEFFLANTSVFPFVQQVGYYAADVALVNLSLVPPEIFSKRLSLTMNTYYQLSVQPTGYFGSLPTNLSLYGPDTNPATDMDVYLPSNLSATNHTFTDWYMQFEIGIQDMTSPFIGATAMADIINTKEIFAYNPAWLALLFVASSITLATGIVALVLKRKTLGPEMFGFVTSMTYENPWVKVPDGGTMLDAMERARLLKDVDVCVADVRGEDSIGHIAFAAGVPVRKLERGRLYC